MLISTKVTEKWQDEFIKQRFPEFNKSTLTYFYDFECNYCIDILNKIKEISNKNDYKIIYINITNSKSIGKYNLAESAYCMSKQNKFYDFSNIIFKLKISVTNEETFIDNLKTIDGFDLQQFNRCTNSDSTKQEVQKAIQLTQLLDVKETPSFLIDKYLISGLEDPEMLPAIMFQITKN